MLPLRAPRRRPSAGFTIAELLISMAVGLLLLAGMATMFVGNSRAQTEIEKANRQIENGRYAMQMITADLNNAGFYGWFDPTPLVNPGAMPDICDTDLADVRANLALPVQGIDNAATTSASCISGVKPGTDVLVVRRVETCVTGAGNCAAVGAGGILFQASVCQNNDELGSLDATKHFSLDTNKDNLTKHGRTCTLTVPGPAAEIRRFLTHVYYVASENVTGDGIPTLKRTELGAGAGGITLTTIPLVEGIEDLQIEYGLDTVRDGAPNLYNANPATAATCAATACALNNWRAAVSAKVHILARNTSVTPGHVDTKKYSLGRKANGDDNLIAAASDGFRRHVFQSTVAIPNTAGRRSQ